MRPFRDSDFGGGMIRDGWLLILIALLALVIRWPLFGTVYWRTGDTVDYVNVARNINSGAGFVESVKSGYFDNRPVVTSAFSGRPVGMALIAAVLLKMTEDLYILQAFSLTVGVVLAGTFYILARSFFPRRIAFLGGLLVAINPNILITSRLYLSETVFGLLVLLAWLVFIKVKTETAKFFLTGLLLGMAYLVRFEGIFLLLIWVGFNWRHGKGMVFLLLGFLIFALPYLVGNTLVNGNPFYSYNFVHFQVREFQEYFGWGYDRSFPTPGVFIKDNFWWIGNKIIQNVFLNVTSLITFGYFGPLSLVLFLALKKGEERWRPLVVFSAVSIGVYALLWSAIFERARHFIPIYLLLLLPLLGLIARSKKNVIVWLLILTTIIGYVAYDIHRIDWARNVDTSIDNWSPKQKGKLFEWIRKNTGNEEIIAGIDPMLVNLFTNRPAILLPYNIYTTPAFEKFVNEYRVKYFLADDPRNFEFFDKHLHLAVVLDGVWLYEK